MFFFRPVVGKLRKECGGKRYRENGVWQRIPKTGIVGDGTACRANGKLGRILDRYRNKIGNDNDERWSSDLAYPSARDHGNYAQSEPDTVLFKGWDLYKTCTNTPNGLPNAKSEDPKRGLPEPKAYAIKEAVVMKLLK